MVKKPGQLVKNLNSKRHSKQGHAYLRIISIQILQPRAKLKNSMISAACRTQINSKRAFKY